MNPKQKATVKRQKRIKAFKASRDKIKAKKRTFPCSIRMKIRKQRRMEEKKRNWNPDSAHAGEFLNEWKPENMRQALYIGIKQEEEGWKEERVSWRYLSKEYDVPFSTLRKRIMSGDINNYDVKSGGKGQSRVLSKSDEGMCTRSSNLIRYCRTGKANQNSESL